MKYFIIPVVTQLIKQVINGLSQHDRRWHYLVSIVALRSACSTFSLVMVRPRGQSNLTNLKCTEIKKKIYIPIESRYCQCACVERAAGWLGQHSMTLARRGHLKDTSSDAQRTKVVVTHCVHAFDKRSEAVKKSIYSVYSSPFDGPVKLCCAVVSRHCVPTSC